LEEVGATKASTLVCDVRKIASVASILEGDRGPMLAEEFAVIIVLYVAACRFAPPTVACDE
jgi:hypothetical protein